MNFRFHPQGLEEFESAIRYYENRQTGLGVRFADSVLTSIHIICRNPESWSHLISPVRRKLTRVFPYAILYVVENDGILVLAVMHCHRKPNYWKNRL